MRGRPVKSEIRRRMLDILHHMGKGYGYQIHKVYEAVYGQVTRESIYYHLKKGVELGEFEVEKIVAEPGAYSWGRTVEKIYYRLGPNAKPPGDSNVAKWFSEHKN